MAQSAVWNEGRRYPQRVKVQRKAGRGAASVEVPLQDVLLAVPFDAALLGRKTWGILLVLALGHFLVVYLARNADTSSHSYVPSVPIEVQMATPLPVEPQVSKPVPLPTAAPKQAKQQPRPVPVPQKTEAPTETPPVHEAAVPEAAETNAPIVRAPAAPAPVQPAVPAETQAVGRMGYLSNPNPVYPESALDRGLEGTVLLRVRVLADGQAESVEVQTSSGYRILDDSAARTVRKWKFMPATRGGLAVDGWANVPIVFKLGK